MNMDKIFDAISTVAMFILFIGVGIAIGSAFHNIDFALIVCLGMALLSLALIIPCGIYKWYTTRKAYFNGRNEIVIYMFWKYGVSFSPFRIWKKANFKPISVVDLERYQIDINNYMESFTRYDGRFD